MLQPFPNQYEGTPVWEHCDLPILKTNNFNFFRCVEFCSNFYGKTISTLHAGNLRFSRTDNRYSQLFPGQKLSYWADSPETARAEVKKWGASNNLLTFWAYDDGSSFIPTVYPSDLLRIIDGIDLRFNEILRKLDMALPLSRSEESLVEQIALAEPDCLAYKSEARKSSTCFLFFEHGFRKLSLRHVSLRLGSENGKNRAGVACAITSDFTPVLEGYGYYFLPKARVRYDKSYEGTEEYLLRKQVEEFSLKKIRGGRK